MQFDSELGSERPVQCLIGNGQLVTTVGPSGLHDASGADVALAATQEFVVAGRRNKGANHPLIRFGSISHQILVDGQCPELEESVQSLNVDLAEVRTRHLYKEIVESVRALIFYHQNSFYTELRIANHSKEDKTVSVFLTYTMPDCAFRSRIDENLMSLEWEAGDNLGVVVIEVDQGTWKIEGDQAGLFVEKVLGPDEEVTVRLVMTVSDRIEYCPNVSIREIDQHLDKHKESWRVRWEQSEVVTGHNAIDTFRKICLYTIFCQATPWSIPPTVSRPYWGAGAFHDEYYPFMALLSAGYEEMARRVPYFRLSTLSEATKRARSQGALYPWSSTEDGLERDPHGHWYSERFHLGIISASVWNLWLYERKLEELEIFYPVVRGCAEFFRYHLLERNEKGNIQTKSCTDFDESVGPVAAGPFTMAAAAYTLDRASDAARRLGVDKDSASAWDVLARELTAAFPADLESKRYIVPGGKADHVSVLGYIVPFFQDVGSTYAYRTLEHIHLRFRTSYGWMPGVSETLKDTTWLWTAGHLAMCHCVVGDAEKAWEAIESGPLSAGQFMSPNEHIDQNGLLHVPWFTTGAGAWLCGLHWMFARVDDSGDYLLSAVPEHLQDCYFRGLRLSRGVSATARVMCGRLVYLSLTAPKRILFAFHIPAKWIHGIWPVGFGKITDLDTHWLIQVELSAGENVIIEATSPPE